MARKLKKNPTKNQTTTLMQYQRMFLIILCFPEDLGSKYVSITYLLVSYLDKHLFRILINMS